LQVGVDQNFEIFLARTIAFLQVARFQDRLAGFFGGIHVSLGPRHPVFRSDAINLGAVRFRGL
jgi:hypothetical protein